MHWQDIKNSAISGRIESESLPVLESYLLHLNSTPYGFDNLGQKFADGVKARIEHAIKLLHDAEATTANTRLHTAALNHAERLHGKSMCKANTALAVSILAIIASIAVPVVQWWFGRAPRDPPQNAAESGTKTALQPTSTLSPDLSSRFQTNSLSTNTTSTNSRPQAIHTKAP